MRLVSERCVSTMADRSMTTSSFAGDDRYGCKLPDKPIQLTRSTEFEHSSEPITADNQLSFMVANVTEHCYYSKSSGSASFAFEVFSQIRISAIHEDQRNDLVHFNLLWRTVTHVLVLVQEGLVQLVILVDVDYLQFEKIGEMTQFLGHLCIRLKQKAVKVSLYTAGELRGSCTGSVYLCFLCHDNVCRSVEIAERSLGGMWSMFETIKSMEIYTNVWLIIRMWHQLDRRWIVKLEILDCSASLIAIIVIRRKTTWKEVFQIIPVKFSSTRTKPLLISVFSEKILEVRHLSTFHEFEPNVFILYAEPTMLSIDFIANPKEKSC